MNIEIAKSTAQVGRSFLVIKTLLTPLPFCRAGRRRDKTGQRGDEDDRYSDPHFSSWNCHRRRCYNATVVLPNYTNIARQSFFSMQMFNWRPAPGEQIASPYLWIYFAVTVPITVIVYILWIGWFKYTQKHYTKVIPFIGKLYALTKGRVTNMYVATRGGSR